MESIIRKKFLNIYDILKKLIIIYHKNKLNSFINSEEQDEEEWEDDIMFT